MDANPKCWKSLKPSTVPVPDLGLRKRTLPIGLDGWKISHGAKEVACLVGWFGVHLFDTIEVTLKILQENLRVAHRSRNSSVVATFV